MGTWLGCSHVRWTSCARQERGDRVGCVVLWPGGAARAAAGGAPCWPLASDVLVGACFAGRLLSHGFQLPGCGQPPSRTLTSRKQPGLLLPSLQHAERLLRRPLLLCRLPFASRCCRRCGGLRARRQRRWTANPSRTWWHERSASCSIGMLVIWAQREGKRGPINRPASRAAGPGRGGSAGRHGRARARRPCVPTRLSGPPISLAAREGSLGSSPHATPAPP